MTVREAAAALNITESLVRRYCRDGDLKAERHGRDWWIEPAVVEAFKHRKYKPRGKTAQSKDK